MYVCVRACIVKGKTASSFDSAHRSECPRHLVQLVQSCVITEKTEPGTEIPDGVGRGRLYLTTHCNNQNDFLKDRNP